MEDKNELEKLEIKYGEHFVRSKSYDYFFKKAERKVTIYDRSGCLAETYKLDEVKDKVRGIMKKKGIEIKPRQTPAYFVSRAVEKGIDLNHIEVDDVISAIMFEFTGARIDIYEKLDKEEIKLFNAIPASEKIDILEFSKRDKFDLLMNFLYMSRAPLYSITPEDSE